MVNRLTPCHSLCVVEPNHISHSFILLALSLALLLFSHTPFIVASPMSWTEKAAFSTDMSTPTLIRNPLVTCPGSMVLFCNDYCKLSTTRNTPIIDVPMSRTKVKMRRIEVNEAGVRAGTPVSVCLESHTLRHFG